MGHVLSTKNEGYKVYSRPIHHEAACSMILFHRCTRAKLEVNEMRAKIINFVFQTLLDTLLFSITMLVQR